MSDQLKELQKLHDDIASALDQVVAEQQNYTEARARVASASQEETVILNRLNEAQRKYDIKTAQLRDKCGGDWSQRNARSRS